MFYKEYLNSIEQESLYNNYNKDIIESINDDNALKIIKILINYDCYFINDLIINYLELFLFEPNVIDRKLLMLKGELGDNFINVLESNINLLID